MKDRSLGLLLVMGSLLLMSGYFIWVFGPYLGISWISRELSEWAVKLPVILAVYIALLIVVWVGYTMITTPPPIPLEKTLEIEREEKNGEKPSHPELT